MSKFVQVSDLKRIEFGITSKCNAGCPLCARHIANTSTPKSFPYLTQSNLPFSDFEKITNSLGNYTKNINCNFGGTVGDAMVHPDALNFFKLASSIYRKVTCDTNGGVRNKDFWSTLGKLSSQYPIYITFSIDGLKDTNPLYRINTNFDNIIDNAKTFIDAGGKADWKYIVFEHNQHQIDEANTLSKQLGFTKFTTHHSRRFKLPTEKVSYDAYKKKASTVNSLVKQQGFELSPSSVAKETIMPKIDGEIKCKSIEQGYLYVCEMNKLWPCCHFHSETTNAKWYNYWNIVETKYGKNFNSLENTTIEQLLNHEYFTEYLTSSWNDNTIQCYKCPETCTIKGTKFKIEETL